MNERPARGPDGAPLNSLSLQIHERDDSRAHRILHLVEVASEPRPLPVVLHALCRNMREVIAADIVSLYVREEEEGDDGLTMRSNVGFAPGAIGNVRLPMGVGITGFAAECMRPVSVTHAGKDSHYEAVPGLDEERYPTFLALPVVQGGRTEGVLVLQRTEREKFEPFDLELAASLTAPFALALERAKSRHREARANVGAGVRDIPLRGRPQVGGTVLARARPLPTLRALTEQAKPDDVPAAIDAVSRDIQKSLAVHEDVRDVMGLHALLADQRFRTQVVDACESQGVAAGLRSVARSYALTPYRVGVERAEGDWLLARAREVANLCLLVAARIAKRPLCEPGYALLVGEHLGALLALEAASKRASAVLAADTVPDAGAIAVLRKASIPTVGEVVGLFDWVRPDDPLLIDGDTGEVRLNPTANQIARVRSEER